MNHKSIAIFPTDSKSNPMVFASPLQDQVSPLDMVPTGGMTQIVIHVLKKIEIKASRERPYLRALVISSLTIKAITAAIVRAIGKGIPTKRRAALDGKDSRGNPFEVRRAALATMLRIRVTACLVRLVVRDNGNFNFHGRLHPGARKIDQRLLLLLVS
jgi:hypothetical protein